MGLRAPAAPLSSALFDLVAEDTTSDLSLRAGETLEALTELDEDGWFTARNADGKEGMVPSNYVEFD